LEIYNSLSERPHENIRDKSTFFRGKNRAGCFAHTAETKMAEFEDNGKQQPGYPRNESIPFEA